LTNKQATKGVNYVRFIEITHIGGRRKHRWT